MGWLWSDSNAPPKDESSLTTSPNEKSSPSVPTPREAPRASTRDEVAEQELNSFIKELSADVQPSSTKYNRVPRQLPTPSKSTASSFNPKKNGPQADPESLGEALLPTTMSCREAFDSAFYCQSLGGQFNNLYRYGTVRSCSENWGDFWFCMRTRGRGDKEKEALIKDHYRQRERRRYGRIEGAVRVEDGKVVSDDVLGGPRSSEDIWKSRDRKMEWGEAFTTPAPVWQGSDEEWQRMERARRAGRVDGTS
ncbi:hypothetical protein PVAG01_03944 [Phlyctema vagabunda]|uniref:Early meiotic induction protein 1 n=1 Tax=Phlyctema vagabunda TaxID=108571 RepID=A0ABR4PMV5_9HELO